MKRIPKASLVLLAVLAFCWSSQALAFGTISIKDMFLMAQGFLPNPDAWVEQLNTLLAGANFLLLAKGIGVALLILGIAWSGKMFMLAGRGSGDLLKFGLRFLLAGVFLFGATEIGGNIYNIWKGGYTWGVNTFVVPTAQKADTVGKDMMKGIQDTANLMVATYAVANGAKKLSEGNVWEVPGAAAEGALTAAKDVALAGMAIATVSWPLILTYQVILMLAGFLVVMAAIMVPIAGAALVFPSGAQWFGLWLKATLGSIMLITFMPMVFAAAFSLGYILPAEKYRDYINNQNAAIAKSTGDLYTDLANTLNLGSNPTQEQIQAQVNDPGWAYQVTNAVYKVVPQPMKNFVLGKLALGAGIVMMIVGIIFGAILINACHRALMGFVGSAVGISGGAAAGAAAAGAAIGTVAGVAGRSAGNTVSATGAVVGAAGQVASAAGGFVGRQAGQAVGTAVGGPVGGFVLGEIGDRAGSAPGQGVAAVGGGIQSVGDRITEASGGSTRGPGSSAPNNSGNTGGGNNGPNRVQQAANTVRDVAQGAGAVVQVIREIRR